MPSTPGLEILKPPKGVPVRGTILFLHGMWEGPAIWVAFVQLFLAAGYRCGVLTLPGYGPSLPVPVPDRGKVPFAVYLARARQAFEELEHPIVVGHSLGGLLAQKIAEELDPPAAVLIAPAAPRWIIALRTWALARAVWRHRRDIFLWHPFLPDKELMDELVLNGTPEPERSRIYEILVPASGRQAFDIAVIGVRVRKKQVTCPMFVAYGTEDHITPASIAKAIVKKHGATARPYTGRAHMLTLEEGWVTVAKDILEWLRGAVSGH